MSEWFFTTCKKLLYDYIMNMFLFLSLVTYEIIKINWLYWTNRLYLIVYIWYSINLIIKLLRNKILQQIIIYYFNKIRQHNRVKKKKIKLEII